MKIIQLSLAALTLTTALVANNDAKTDLSLRTIYTTTLNDNSANTYATAAGVTLSYKTKTYNNLYGVATLRSTKDFSALSGDGSNKTDELSGSKGEYAALSEAYVNYIYKNMELRLGRQSIDTPLADSDDIRMIPNSFEAYTLAFDFGDFEMIGGFLNKWQGVDAGLDNGWVKTGDTTFMGAMYATNIVETNFWGYHIDNGANASNSLYVDATIPFDIQGVKLSIAGQYLMQRELENSGIEADIYGGFVSAVFGDFEVAAAYNASTKKDAKASLSGFGGGALFSSMENMILDEITQDRDAQALSATCGFNIANVSIAYAYGDFSGDKDSSGIKAHIVEHNLYAEYEVDDMVFSLTYAKDENKEDSSSNDFNYQTFRAFVEYKFQ